MKFCLSMIKSTALLFLVILVLSSIHCTTVVSNITIASGIDSSPTLSPAGIGTLFSISVKSTGLKQTKTSLGEAIIKSEAIIKRMEFVHCLHC